MMIGLCGAELVRPESVGASQGFLGESCSGAGRCAQWSCLHALEAGGRRPSPASFLPCQAGWRTWALPTLASRCQSSSRITAGARTSLVGGWHSAVAVRGPPAACPCTGAACMARASPDPHPCTLCCCCSAAGGVRGRRGAAGAHDQRQVVRAAEERAPGGRGQGGIGRQSAPQRNTLTNDAGPLGRGHDTRRERAEPHNVSRQGVHVHIAASTGHCLQLSLHILPPRPRQPLPLMLS